MPVGEADWGDMGNKGDTADEGKDSDFGGVTGSILITGSSRVLFPMRSPNEVPGVGGTTDGLVEAEGGVGGVGCKTCQVELSELEES